MEKQIKRLRRVASIIKLMGWVVWIVVFSILYQNTKVDSTPLPTINSFSLIPLVIIAALSFIPAFIIFVGGIVLDFLADLGQEVENLKWGVNDLRRKAVAISGETETIAAPVTKS